MTLLSLHRDNWVVQGLQIFAIFCITHITDIIDIVLYAYAGILFRVLIH